MNHSSFDETGNGAAGAEGSKRQALARLRAAYMVNEGLIAFFAGVERQFQNLMKYDDLDVGVADAFTGLFDRHCPALAALKFQICGIKKELLEQSPDLQQVTRYCREEMTIPEAVHCQNKMERLYPEERQRLAEEEGKRQEESRQREERKKKEESEQREDLRHREERRKREELKKQEEVEKQEELKKREELKHRELEQKKCNWLKRRNNPMMIAGDGNEPFRVRERRRQPEYVSKGYVDNGNGTVTDQDTGLTWQRSGSTGTLKYDAAGGYIENLNRQNFGGRSDWRLPTMDELLSLVEAQKTSNGLYIDPIFDGTQQWCWSSDRRSSGDAWFVFFSTCDVGWYYLDYHLHVRAVHP